MLWVHTNSLFQGKTQKKWEKKQQRSEARQRNGHRVPATQISAMLKLIEVESLPANEIEDRRAGKLPPSHEARLTILLKQHHKDLTRASRPYENR